MIEALEEMEACAEEKDNRGFYKALLSFTAAGISASGNPVLHQVAESIMPNLQRLQYIAVMLRGGALTQNCAYFKTIIEALDERDPPKGVAAIEAYIRNEKSYVLELVKSTSLSKYLDQDEA